MISHKAARAADLRSTGTHPLETLASRPTRRLVTQLSVWLMCSVSLVTLANAEDMSDDITTAITTATISDTGPDDITITSRRVDYI